jgi:PPOX class probable F420-dependent enzyme
MPKADRISEGGVKLLQEPQLAHFVTVSPSGVPQVTPVWVDVEADGSHILINTAASGRKKIQNVQENPQVAVSVVDAKDPWRYVTVQGTVTEIRTEGARAHIDFLSKKYTGNEKYAGPADEQRVILRIQPHHVLEQGV